MPIDRKQLPQSAEVLQQMVLDLIAQLDASEARRIKTENLLRQLLAARSGRRSEQITEEQLALFEAELKAQGGALLAQRVISPISYHGVLARAPAGKLLDVVATHEVRWLSTDGTSSRTSTPSCTAAMRLWTYGAVPGIAGLRRR